MKLIIFFFEIWFLLTFCLVKVFFVNMIKGKFWVLVEMFVFLESEFRLLSWDFYLFNEYNLFLML